MPFSNALFFSANWAICPSRAAVLLGGKLAEPQGLYGLRNLRAPGVLLLPAAGKPLALLLAGPGLPFQLRDPFPAGLPGLFQLRQPPRRVLLLPPQGFQVLPEGTQFLLHAAALRRDAHPLLLHALQFAPGRAQLGLAGGGFLLALLVGLPRRLGLPLQVRRLFLDAPYLRRAAQKP